MLGALLLITLGILFLLNNLYPAEFAFSRMWPIVLIVIGFVKIVEHFQHRKVSTSSTATASSDQRSRTSDGRVEKS